MILLGVYRFTWFTLLNREFYNFVDGLQVYLVYMILKEIILFCGRFTGLPSFLDLLGKLIILFRVYRFT